MADPIKKRRTVVFAETHKDQEVAGPSYMFEDDLTNAPENIRNIMSDYSNNEATLQKMYDQQVEGGRHIENHLKGYFSDNELGSWDRKMLMYDLIADDMDNSDYSDMDLPLEGLYKDTSFTKKLKKLRDIESKRVALSSRQTQLYHQFYDPEINPRTQRTYESAKPFMKEANKLKLFNDKRGIDTEIYPVYASDSSLIKEKLAGLGSDDDVALFGHSGSRIAGLPLEWWNGELAASDYGDCFLGSCGAEGAGMVEKLKDTKNLHHTTNKSWMGVNPYGEDVNDAMFSIVAPDSTTTPVLGEHYKVSNKEFAKGGNVMGKVKTLRPKGFGGWLEENDDLIASTVLGGVGTALLGPVGGIIGSKVGSMIAGGNDAEEVAPDYVAPRSKSRQHYQRAENGMNLDKLTKYKGPKHGEGGISLDGLGVEVEGGETRTNNMIHSDQIKITKKTIKAFPGVLTDADKGKTMADITKLRSKKFDRRKWDEMNDKAAELATMPLEEISEMLSVDPSLKMKADGGSVDNTSALAIINSGRIRGRNIPPKRMTALKPKAGAGMNLDKLGESLPLITSGLDLVGNLIEGPEEVDYGRTSYAPTKVNYIDAEPGTQRIRRTFGNAESKLRKYNPSRYLARSADLASREAEAVTDHAGNVQATNAQFANRANMMDSQNATRTNMFNKQVKIQEANANAANRGMHRSNISGSLANMGTIAGQMTRDKKLGEASERYNDRWFDMMEKHNAYLRGESSTVGDMDDIYLDDPTDEFERFERRSSGGSLTKNLRSRNLKK